MAYTANDAFCAQTDVEGVAGIGTFTGSTVPTQQQVLDWMARRAAEIEGVLATAGLDYTVTSRGNPFPASPSAEIGRLKILCESANALAAAAQAMAIKQGPTSQDTPSPASERFEEYKLVLDQIRSLAEDVEAVTLPLVTGASVNTKIEDLTFNTSTQW